MAATRDGGKSGGDSAVLPEGGEVPERKIEDLTPAAKAAGCTLTSYKGKSREHTDDLAEKIKYDSNPPTEGRHFAIPAEDGAYDTPPDIKELVHSMEHGRVIIWFKKSLPEDQRADLKALFDDDSYQMLLTPDPTGMKYAGGGHRLVARADAQRHRPSAGLHEVHRRDAGRDPGLPRRVPRQRA